MSRIETKRSEGGWPHCDHCRRNSVRALIASFVEKPAYVIGFGYFKFPVPTFEDLDFSSCAQAPNGSDSAYVARLATQFLKYAVLRRVRNE